MNNCKNCGARFHPEECDYCGTPTEASHRELLRAYASCLSDGYGNLVGLADNQTLMGKTINERSLVYDQAVMNYESARQIYAGKGLVQITVPPKRTIASLFGFV